MTEKAPFDQAIADEICRRMAAGNELKDVCKEEGMPSFQTVMDWHSANSQFSRQLVQARDKMFDTLVAEGKADPRPKTNYTILRAGQQEGWKGPPDQWGSILFFVSCCFSFALLFGFNRTLNFLPSSPWQEISAALSLGLGAVFAFSTAPVAAWVLGRLVSDPDNEEQADNAEIAYGGGRTAPVFATLLNGFFFYWLIVYGIGSAMTAFSSTIEKDIVGTKYHYYSGSSCLWRCRGGRGPDSYSIMTADLPGNSYARFYITGDEYRAIPAYLDEVHAHVMFKQSFFGLTVEDYILPKK